MDLINFDTWSVAALGADLAIVVALLLSLRVLKGWVAGVDLRDLMERENNIALGISLAGGIIALTLMISGVLSGGFATTLMEEALTVVVYGVFGMLLIIAGRLIQDKLVFPGIPIQRELVSGNSALAIADFGNMVATGLVVRATMNWIETDGFGALPILLIAFILGQVLLLLASYYRVILFKARNVQGTGTLQKAISGGNQALALRFAAYLIGIGLVITAATGIVNYDPERLILGLATWAGAMTAAAVLFSVLVMLIRKIILAGVNVTVEVDEQGNLGVAAVEAGIFFAVSFILMALLV
jgi:uncharacterized membrane protein YjfL (UPF0719 family)